MQAHNPPSQADPGTFPGQRVVDKLQLKFYITYTVIQLLHQCVMSTTQEPSGPGS